MKSKYVKNIPKRIKPFKAENPFKTANKIRKILESIEVFTIERSSSKNGLYTAHIEIEGLEGLKQVNGKGLSYGYALASAYGELMERIQNDFFIRVHIIDMLSDKNNHQNILSSIGIDAEFNFRENPDEKIITFNDYFKDRSFISNEEIELLEIKRQYSKKLLCIPFWNVKRKKIELLDAFNISYLCTTNGLCAGNTAQEAIIQGICEIFERYAIKKIYKNNITPPSIPGSFFMGTKIYNIIKMLEEKYDYKIIIKDCSLGLNLPVIGVLLIDINRHKYTFHLGSDPSPITSIERCLTEIYQGGSKLKLCDFYFSKMPFDNEEFYVNNKHRNYNKTIRNGTGIWPMSIFLDKPSYNFNGFKHNITKDDKEDLKYLINLTFNLNYELYIREVSFLGFPSFRIYIPGMSEQWTIEENRKYSLEKSKYRKILINLNNSELDELGNLAQYIENEVKAPRTLIDERNLNPIFGIPHTNKILKHLHPYLFLAILYYKLKNLKKSFEYIDIFIERILKNNKGNGNPYYLCARDYLYLKINNTMVISTIRNYLSKAYKKKIVEKVLKDFSSSNSMFKYMKLPNNYDCKNCTMSSECKIKRFVNLKLKIDKIREENVINQNNLKNIFTF